MRRYLGDVQAAMERADRVCPSKAELIIDTRDTNAHRYGVTIWNVFGKWYASEPTLAESIHAALDKAYIDNFEKPKVANVE